VGEWKFLLFRKKEKKVFLLILPETKPEGGGGGNVSFPSRGRMSRQRCEILLGFSTGEGKETWGNGKGGGVVLFSFNWGTRKKKRGGGEVVLANRSISFEREQENNGERKGGRGGSTYLYLAVRGGGGKGKSSLLELRGKGRKIQGVGKKGGAFVFSLGGVGCAWKEGGGNP